MASPIIVELSAVENKGYEMAGTAPAENVQAQIESILIVGGYTSATAQYMAQKLAEQAMSARAKIKAATAFEIQVVEEAPAEESKPTKKGVKNGKAKG